MRCDVRSLALLPGLLLAGWSGAGEVAPTPGVPHGWPGPVESRRDTVVQVRPGDRLRVETWRGTLSVRTHEEDEIRLTGSDGDRGGFRRDGRLVEVTGAGAEREGDRVLLVPAWLGLEVRSRELEVDAAGLRGGLDVRLLEGEVRLRGIQGEVVVEIYDGEITVREGAGDFALTTLDGDIRVQGVTGRVEVESTDGELELLDVEGPLVRGVTVDGDIRFRGRVGPEGELSLSTHDGDVTAWLPADFGAEVRVTTFDGSFEADVPVRTNGFRAGEPLFFTVGPGGARVVLESFDGDIQLRTW